MTSPSSHAAHPASVRLESPTAQLTPDTALVAWADAVAAYRGPRRRLDARLAKLATGVVDCEATGGVTELSALEVAVTTQYVNVVLRAEVGADERRSLPALVGTYWAVVDAYTAAGDQVGAEAFLDALRHPAQATT